MNPTPSLDPKGEAGAKKTPLQLLPPYALAQTALAHAEGAKKYGHWNWRTNKVCATTYIGAILRHLTAWQDGEDIDADSGLSHIAKIGACCNILLDAGYCGTLVDDRSKVPSKMTVEQVKEVMEKIYSVIDPAMDLKVAPPTPPPGYRMLNRMRDDIIDGDLIWFEGKWQNYTSERLKRITDFTGFDFLYLARTTNPVPLGLPPLPPVPEGFSRWEYRGMGWNVDLATYTCLRLGKQEWQPIIKSRANGYQDTHYIEAVK